MRTLGLLLVFLAAPAFAEPLTPISPEIQKAVQAAGLTGTVQAACTAHFYSRNATAVVVAVESSLSKGAYFVLNGSNAKRLGTYSGGADLQCMSPKDVVSINSSIRASGNAGVHGGVQKNNGLDIVCGFVENTEAVCWGYDVKKKEVVTKGGWIT